MKKIFLMFALFLVMLLSGCAVPYQTIEGYIDYTMYTDNGFFVTESDAVPFEYNGVGSLYVINLDGYESGVYKRASFQDAVTKLVEKAMLNKADGLIKLSVQTYYDQGYKRNGCYATGMAIKKKK